MPKAIVNQDDVEEDEHKLAQVRAKYVVHKTLKGGRDVFQAKVHNQKLIVAGVCTESHLGISSGATRI